MDMKTKLYLDTSIPSSFFDYSKPVRQLLTQKWFENETYPYNLHISVLTIEEIERLENTKRKDNIKDLLLQHKVKVLKISNEAKELADMYIKKGAIPRTEPEDALHIAIATIDQLDALASWNFKHIVSINPIRKIHEVNKIYNYPLIQIGSLELFGGAKYGNL